MNQKYKLNFISDHDLLEHVTNTVSQYRFDIDLKDFNRNIVDPIKMTFDAKIYGKNFAELIEAESIRQIDKSNTNHIGYFHQNIFQYIEGWEVPPQGFDVVNKKLNIYAEIKNKHNTMNSSSAQRTYIMMQDKILRDDQATCYLVEVIARNSQDIPWQISLNKEPVSHRCIRRISIDKFYEVVTGEKTAFSQLCNILPQVIEDAVTGQHIEGIQNSVFAELKEFSPDILKSIYLLAFEKYQGFEI